MKTDKAFLWNYERFHSSFYFFVDSFRPKDEFNQQYFLTRKEWRSMEQGFKKAGAIIEKIKKHMEAEK